MALTIKLRFSYYKKFEMDIWGLLQTTFFFEPLNERKRHRALKFFPWKRIKRPLWKNKRENKYQKYLFLSIDDRHKFDSLEYNVSKNLGFKRFFRVNVNASIWRNLRLIRIKYYIFTILNLKFKRFFFFLNIWRFLKMRIFNFIHKELLFFLPIKMLKSFLFNFLKIWKILRKKFCYRFRFIKKYRKSFFYRLTKFFFNAKINIHSIYENNKLQNLFEFFFFLSKKYKENRMKKFQRYVYRIDIIDPKKKIKKKPYHYIALRLVRLYYLIYHYRQFNRLAKRIRKLDGLFEQNFCIALEGRLITALYRTGLVSHIFECIDIVNGGYFLINQSVIGQIHTTVRLGDLMGFAYEYKWLLYYRLLWRILRKSIVLKAPRYLFVSYSLLLAYMYRLPYESDLVFPSSVDMFRATGYFR